jgi:hypothetical protein
VAKASAGQQARGVDALNLPTKRRVDGQQSVVVYGVSPPHIAGTDESASKSHEVLDSLDALA